MNAKLQNEQDPESGTAAGDPDRMLLCAACQAPVARPQDRCERDGAHSHRLTNPAGVEYEIGCFTQAPGVRAQGQPTTFFSWFPGYGWRVGACASCGAHLGWEFSGPDIFFGLILRALTGE